MKILVVSTPVFKLPVVGYSGLEHLAWQQAKGLAAKGHQVSVVAPDGSECPGCDIIACGPERSWDEHAFYQRYWPDLPTFDVIIDNSWAKWPYLLKAEGKLQAPVLGVMHAPVNTMYKSWPPHFRDQDLPPVEKACAVCISEDQASHFRGLHGVDCRVCYNGVDMDFYKPIGMPRSGRFLFLARFSSIKGPDLAIDACRKAGVGLDLVGDTSITQEPEFFQKCKEACDGFGGGAGVGPMAFTGKGTGIRMVGPASRGECVHWFSQAHCMVHPNQRFREPFGLAPVEAMACGCPVIAWDFGAMRETVKHGETGRLVRSTDELEKAVRELGVPLIDPEARVRCRDWAGQFSVQKMVDRYEALCQEAIEGGGW